MAAALQSFSAMAAKDSAGPGERKLALLGQMRELGSCSLQEHERVLRTLRSCGIDAFRVGEDFRRALRSLQSAASPAEGRDVSFRCFDSSSELADYLHSNPLEHYTILIKGSRSVEMEKVLPEL